MVERAHRRLKKALKASMAAADWPQSPSPGVLLDINGTTKGDSGTSAAEMVYGTSLTSDVDPKLFFSDPDSTFREISDPYLNPLLSKEAKAKL